MDIFRKTRTALQAIQDGYKRIPPEIISERCNGCGLCVQVCPAGMFTLGENSAGPNPSPDSFCIKCGHCLAICPVDAIFDPEHRYDEPARVNRKAWPEPAALETLLRSRRTVRCYRPDPVPRALLSQVIEAGRYTATGGNRQDVFYTVIDARARIQELKDLMIPYLLKLFKLFENPLFLTGMYLTGNLELIGVPATYAPLVRRFAKLSQNGQDAFFYQAPAMIIVHTRKMDQPAGFGCAAALYNCSLMAELLGLGCCFNGFLHVSINNNRKIKDWLGIPRHHQCHGAMTLGYPAVKFARIPHRDQAKIDWR